MFKKRAIFALIICFIVVGSTTFGILMYLDRRDYRNYLQNQYEKDLYDIVNDVEGLSVSLSKVPVASSTKQKILVFSEIWKNASDAQQKLNSLPVSHTSISQTSKFLAQVADFSYSLLKASNSGQKLSQTELNNVEKLRDFAGYLSIQLRNFEASLTEGDIKWGEIKEGGSTSFNKAASKTIDAQFKTLSDEMQQYPTLIYDGPFAENVLNIKPRVLSEKEISQKEAKDIVSNILKNKNIESINLYSDKKGEKIPAYSFTVKIKDKKDEQVNIDISKNGGKVVYMLYTREVPKSSIDIKSAIKKGMEFLENNGYKDMIPTYSLKYDNVAVINYVYVKDKVVVYPDQIKLKVALDNGEIIGIEAAHYLVAHYEREIKKPRITAKEARVNVSQNLNVKNIRLTIIPMESQREILCYEFFGDYKGEKYLVYINALDGTEEKILKIIDTENGELTM
ncbi:germination protein YpeB [Caloramator sp. E03]|uniref:germination protein YpeB n=1 Tax=Caloramator sp. E03 TaxID=2576307 RepID=UPI001110FA04|nr:germination protein YpeB [Caloramator sp. E03]QCX33410.1 germination protein YpeB [Caloramator sp. E03]